MTDDNNTAETKHEDKQPLEPLPQTVSKAYVWNGGPGGASYMVNIGGMGAVRVKTDGMAHLTGVGEVEDNPYSLLPSSDLVFIDAFGTGYSHVDPNYGAKKVWGGSTVTPTRSRAASSHGSRSMGA